MELNFIECVRMMSFLKNVILSLLFGLIFCIQKAEPGFFGTYALWSDHPRWWQFFTSGFLSGNWIHLTLNMLGIWVVCSQFASQIRLFFLLTYFVLFSAVSSFLYYYFFMPPHAWLVGASGGVYALIGFLSWFQRRDHVCFLGIRKFAMPFLPAMLILLMIEFLIATFWLPVLAWQLHIIAFSISILTAMIVHAVYAGIRRLAEREKFVFKGVLEQAAVLLRKVKRAVVNVPVITDQ